MQKPFFNPPNWLFGTVWTVLYILMGIACYLVWNANLEKELKQKALLFYAIQLCLNFLWSFIFFYAHQPGWAAVEIVLLWIFILLSIIYFNKISKLAAGLLVPYICWVSFAAVLNIAIWRLN